MIRKLIWLSRAKKRTAAGSYQVVPDYFVANRCIKLLVALKIKSASSEV